MDRSDITGVVNPMREAAGSHGVSIAHRNIEDIGSAPAFLIRRGRRPASSFPAVSLEHLFFVLLPLTLIICVSLLAGALSKRSRQLLEDGANLGGRELRVADDLADRFSIAKKLVDARGHRARRPTRSAPPCREIFNLSPIEIVHPVRVANRVEVSAFEAADRADVDTQNGGDL
jgi:hypothetical protein